MPDLNEVYVVMYDHASGNTLFEHVAASQEAAKAYVYQEFLKVAPYLQGADVKIFHDVDGRYFTIKAEGFTYVVTRQRVHEDQTHGLPGAP